MTDSSQLDRLKAALASRYDIVREVGSGGMATVYLATDVRHQRRVALKVLRPELSATMGPERFLQEVRVTANLQHPHILPLFDSGDADGFLFYVMPYVDGESLRDRLAREGELPVVEAARLLRDVVDALAAAHAMGIVHRDVKPENILLSGRHALVTDFGVAKAVSEATGKHRLTTVGVALGTPAYMAPEQAAADDTIDHRADIYAVGAVAYELLTGKPPFTGRTPQQILAAQVTEKPAQVTEHRASVPPGLETLVMRCLEKKPADRWQRIEEMLPHLEGFATPSGGMTPTQLMPTTVARPRSLAKWTKVAAGTAAAMAVAAALWVTFQNTQPGDAEAATAAADSEPRRLIVVPLDNLTGDEDVDVWAQLAADWIGRAIDRPHPVDVVPASAVRDAIKALGAGASVNALAERLGARWAVAGSLARTGGQVRFEVEFRDMKSGERLRSLAPIVGPVDSVEAVVGRLAEAAAAAAVTLLDPGQPTGVALMSLAPSVEVFRQSMEQGEVFCRGDYAGAIEIGNKALQGAPDYIPLLQMNRVAYSNLGRNVESDSVTKILEGFRDRMTTTERADQDWMRGNIYGDPKLATRAVDEWFRIDPTFAGYMAGLTYLRTNRLQGALERFLAYDLDAPCNKDWRPWWTNTATTYHLLERYEDELTLARRGLQRFPGYRPIIDREAAALAALGRVQAVDSLLDFVYGLPAEPADGDRSLIAALELRAHGHAQAADATMKRALDWYAARPPNVERASRGGAFRFAGRWADADTLFAALLVQAPDNLTYLRRRGVALAQLGRREEALAISRRLEALLGRPDLDGNNVAGEAEIAAALGDRDEAVRQLKRAFDVGYGYNAGLHRDPVYDGLRGYAPWDNLVKPRP